jgi:hypothetical protein
MALNQQSILASMQATKPFSQEAYLQNRAEYESAMAKQATNQTPSTFEGQLSNAMLGREILPNVATQERMLMKQYMSTPSDVSTRLNGIVSPLQETQLIGQQQGTLMDQLGSLADVRTNKRQELKDIIANTALGYKAQYEKEKANLDMLSDQVNMSWREYTEAVRQREHQESLSNKGPSKTDETVEADKLRKEMNAYMDHREETEPDWDRYMGAQDYIDFANKAVKDMGPTAKQWFFDTFPVDDWVVDNAKEVGELKREGLDYYDVVNSRTEAQKLSRLEQAMTNSVENVDGVIEESDWRSLYNSYLKSFPKEMREAINLRKLNSVQKIFYDAMVQNLGEVEGKALFKRIFEQKTSVNYDENGRMVLA